MREYLPLSFALCILIFCFSLDFFFKGGVNEGIILAILACSPPLVTFIDGLLMPVAIGFSEEGFHLKYRLKYKFISWESISKSNILHIYNRALFGKGRLSLRLGLTDGERITSGAISSKLAKITYIQFKKHNKRVNNRRILTKNQFV